MQNSDIEGMENEISTEKAEMEVLKETAKAKAKRGKTMLSQVNYLSREEMLQLPISTKSWILLKDYVLHHADKDIFVKIISDYLEQCPLFELVNILLVARIMLDTESFQQVTECVFQH